MSWVRPPHWPYWYFLLPHILFSMFQSSRLSLNKIYLSSILDSIVVSIPACHAGDQGSIPCRGAVLLANKAPVVFLFIFVLKSAPRQGIEPWSPAWQAGILTTILSRTGSYRSLSKVELTLEIDRQSTNPVFWNVFVVYSCSFIIWMIDVTICVTIHHE